MINYLIILFSVSFAVGVPGDEFAQVCLFGWSEHLFILYQFLEDFSFWLWNAKVAIIFFYASIVLIKKLAVDLTASLNPCHF
jgi:hypothetical protein